MFVGLILGLQCTLHPFLANPVFGEIAALPVAEQARRMADPAFKARVLAAKDEGKVRKLGGGLVRLFDLMYELGDPPDYEPDPTTSISARAESSRSASKKPWWRKDAVIASQT